ncbi:MAG: winged helix-turn-helix domain-containing protein [Chloroflexota bacterium]|nr:MAG: winged helix-turn-helix domain-containing protein [Chloroflexota bacterium]
MFYSIGEAAGEIWRILSAKDGLSVSALVRNVKQPQSVVYMGIGWLAREDKLVFTKTKQGVSISIKK